ncbi:hypothetical protein D3C86_1063170 [compost metagenome]
MHSRALGGADDRVTVDFAKARNVIGDVALEQLHVLWQVAEPGTQFALVPGEHVRAVQAHLACLRRPDADQQAGEGGFARGGRADNAKAFAGDKAEAHPAQNRVVGTGGTGIYILHGQHAHWPLQRHARWPAGIVLQHLVEPAPGRTAAEQLLPRRDDLLHRAQSTAGEDRAGNHHPRCDLAFDRQQCAGAEDQRLQSDPHEAPGAADNGGAVGGQGLHFQNTQMALVPALADRRQHAHGLDDLGIAQVVVGVLG